MDDKQIALDQQARYNQLLDDMEGLQHKYDKTLAELMLVREQAEKYKDLLRTISMVCDEQENPSGLIKTINMWCRNVYNGRGLEDGNE